MAITIHVSFSAKSRTSLALVRNLLHTGNYNISRSCTVFRLNIICGRPHNQCGKQIHIPWEYYNKHSTFNVEIPSWCEECNWCFYRLKDRVLPQGGLKKCTKMVVYYVCVMTCLLYSCETLVVYLRHLDVLERFQQYCLR